MKGNKAWYNIRNANSVKKYDEIIRFVAFRAVKPPFGCGDEICLYFMLL